MRAILAHDRGAGAQRRCAITSTCSATTLLDFLAAFE